MGLIILFLKFLCEVLHIRNIELTKSSTKLDITVHPIYGKNVGFMKIWEQFYPAIILMYAYRVFCF